MVDNAELNVLPAEIEQDYPMDRGVAPILRDGKCGGSQSRRGEVLASSAIFQEFNFHATHTMMENHRPTKRKRSALACDACRARRTKCDAQKPSCRYCQTHGLACVYQEGPAEPPSR